MCQACHRRDFSMVVASVVIRSIRILVGISHAMANRHREDPRSVRTHIDLPFFPALHAGRRRRRYDGCT